MEQFKAGVAKVDITPTLGTIINGDFVGHYVRNIHDPLYSKALVLQDKQMTVVIVVVDITAMGKMFIDHIKNEIFKLTQISLNNILISATHTHAAGSIESLLLSAADLPYRQKLSVSIISSVMKAKQNLQPAKIAYGMLNMPEHVVCRRYLMNLGYKAYNPVTDGVDKVKTNPFGHEGQIVKRAGDTDTGLSYLAVQGMDNQWISVLANYSMHYVGDWENGTITADYFGIFSKQIQVKLRASDNFVGMLTNGTSGDANIVDFLQPNRYPKDNFQKSKFIGNDMAEKVFQSLKDAEWEINPSLSAQYE
ncbi:MAG: neutral/alkaline non-lysosomal ceramidase N-terminal domain-containing protein, partial [Chitinophagaceae bacterium]